MNNLSVEEFKQDFKELKLYMDDIYTQDVTGVKDAGHLWIDFSDKFNAFEKRVIAAITTIKK